MWLLYSSSLIADREEQRTENCQLYQASGGGSSVVQPRARMNNLKGVRFFMERTADPFVETYSVGRRSYRSADSPASAYIGRIQFLLCIWLGILVLVVGFRRKNGCVAYAYYYGEPAR